MIDTYNPGIGPIEADTIDTSEIEKAIAEHRILFEAAEFMLGQKPDNFLAEELAVRSLDAQREAFQAINSAGDGLKEILEDGVKGVDELRDYDADVDAIRQRAKKGLETVTPLRRLNELSLRAAGISIETLTTLPKDPEVKALKIKEDKVREIESAVEKRIKREREKERERKEALEEEKEKIEAIIGPLSQDESAILYTLIANLDGQPVDRRDFEANGAHSFTNPNQYSRVKAFMIPFLARYFRDRYVLETGVQGANRATYVLRSKAQPSASESAQEAE